MLFCVWPLSLLYHPLVLTHNHKQFFNEDSIIVPLEDPLHAPDTLPLYQLLAKPHYPPNLKYVLSGEAKYPIGMTHPMEYDHSDDSDKHKTRDNTVHRVALQVRAGGCLWTVVVGCCSQFVHDAQVWLHAALITAKRAHKLPCSVFAVGFIVSCGCRLGCCCRCASG